MPSFNSLKYIIIILILILYSLVSSYFAFFAIKTKSSTPSINETTQTESSFFDSQSATVKGKITQSSKETITVINEKDQTDTLPLSSNYLVTDLQNPATEASKMKQIQTGKDAVINLTLEDDVYKVTYISYQTLIRPIGSMKPGSSDQAESNTPTITSGSPKLQSPPPIPSPPVVALPTPPATP